MARDPFNMAVDAAAGGLDRFVGRRRGGGDAGGGDPFADYLQRTGFTDRLGAFAQGAQLSDRLGAYAQGALAGPDRLGAFAQGFQARDPFTNISNTYQNWDARKKAEREAAAAAAKAAGKPQPLPGQKVNEGVGDGSGDPATAQWRPLIEKIAAEHADIGMDPDRLQAIISFESNGNARAVSPQGAAGLGQVMPFHFKPGEDPFDPETNLRVVARVLREKYEANGRDWDRATMGYLGWGTDAHGTTPDVYIAKVREREAAIKARPRAGASGGAAGELATAWGNANVPITQEFGTTDFSTGAGAAIYDFGAQFGLDGDQHTGLDIGLPYGSAVYTPVSGTVVIAGNGAYSNVGGGTDPATSGEVRIRLDNGEELILGHLSAINIRAGQRIEAGTRVGASGDREAPHLHIEWRVPDRSTPSGWRIIDPRQRLRHSGPLPPGHYPGDGHQH